MAIQCPCGMSNPDGSRFCGQCGKECGAGETQAAVRHRQLIGILLGIMGVLVGLWVRGC